MSRALLLLGLLARPPSAPPAPPQAAHLTDPTTCHCVLSKLSDTTGLPEVLAAVAPPLP